MREIVLDTETTGLDPFQGHRLIEIGCVELLNRIPSGQTFHFYVNPERDVPAEAYAVHGISTDQLEDKPLFAGSPRNSSPSSAMRRWSRTMPCSTCASSMPSSSAPARPGARERLVDTLLLARRQHPGASNRLDDLCARYGIDNSRRTKHGALLDAEILAEVYLELIGARQAQLGLVETSRGATMRRRMAVIRVRPRRWRDG